MCRNIKRWMSVILIFAFTLVGAVPAQAVVAEQEEDTCAINEYQALQNMHDELESTSTSKFQSEYNLSDEELAVIENYQQYYSEKIVQLKQYTDEQLRNVDYTEDQVAAIREFDPNHVDEDILMRAATSVDVSGDFQNYEHGENGTTVEYIVEFHWNGIASNWFNDIFAITWNSPLNETDSDGYVNYKSVSGFVSEVKHNPRPEGLYATAIEFPKYLHDNEHGEASYVNAGSIIGILHANTNVRDITGYCAYGHTMLDINPGFTVGSAGVSISFDTGIKKVGEDRFYR